MNFDSIDQVLTLLTVAPLVILGAWYIAVESFAGADLPHSSRTVESLEKSNYEGIAKWKSAGLNVQFTFWSGAILLSSVTLLLLWEKLGAAIFPAFVAAVSLIIFRQRKDAHLQTKIAEQITLELPQVIQTICLLIAAGISPIKALQIISQGSNSNVALEFKKVLTDVSNGMSAISALDRSLTRAPNGEMRRFITSMVIAVERGSPLVPILISLVRDSQGEWRNQLLKRAGKAEIALMIPVVFLLLPLSVLFALFPSILELQGF